MTAFEPPPPPQPTDPIGRPASSTMPGARPRRRTCGRYQIAAEIARGGMGVVYRAYDPGLQRELALKMLLVGRYEEKVLVERFLREARTLARMRHPAIIGVHEVGFEDGRPYLVMDLVEGGSLEDRLRQGPLPIETALDLTLRVTRAIDYAHGEGFLHRDLKPANVLLTAEGHPLVTDFGLVLEMDNRHELTRTGQPVGTPAYMPPEQASGKKEDFGPHSDVYSLGATLYHLIVGRPPFEAPSILNVISAILTEPPRPPRVLRPETPRDVEQIILRCLAKEPADRYDSAAALAADLGRAIEGRPIDAARSGPAARAGRARLIVASLVAAIVTSIIVGLFVVPAIAERRRAQARALEREGLALLRAGEEETATARLAAAIALDADLLDARCALARLALDARDLDGARAHVDAAIAIAPEDPDALDLRGRLAALSGVHVEAIAAWDAAWSAGLRRREPGLALAEALLREGEAERARPILDTLLETSPTALDVLAERAACLDALGATVSAEEDRWRRLAIAAQAGPSSPARDRLVNEALGEIVARRLAAGDVEGLSRLWEEVHRRLGRPGDPGIQEIARDDADRLLRDLEDGDAPLAARLRAAIGLSVLPRPGVTEPLRAVATGAGGERPALVAEAAWATLLGHEVGARLADWAAGRDGEAGAARAITVIERARRLGPDEVRTLGGLGFDEPIVRAAAAIAIGIAATRAGGPGAELTEGALRSLGRPDATAAATTERVTRALAILRTGKTDRDEDDDALADAILLAGALVLAPEWTAQDVDASRSRWRAALDDAIEVTAGPARGRLLARRARHAAEEGRLADARRDVDRAIAIAADDPGILELDHILGAVQRRSAERTPWLERLAALDPVAADAAQRRAELSARHGFPALPGPNGMSRIVVSLRPDPGLPDLEERFADAFELWSSVPRFEPRGLVTEGVTTMLSKFTLEECASVEYRSAHVGECTLDLFVATSAEHRHHGYGINRRTERRAAVVVDGLRGGHGVVIPKPLRAVTTVLRRDELSVWDAGRLAVRSPPVARLARRRGGRIFIVNGWLPGEHPIERITAIGRIGPTAATRRARPRSEPLPPLPGETTLTADRAEGAPSTLEALRRDGATFGTDGSWVANSRRGHTLGVRRLRGDVRIEARVDVTDPNNGEGGLALVTETANGGVIWWGVRRAMSVGEQPRIWMSYQRGERWETPLLSAPWPGGPVHLVLERRGDHILAWHGASPDDLTPLAERGFYFPLDNPVEAVLCGRNGRGENPVRFDRVELRAELHPAGRWD